MKVNVEVSICNFNELKIKWSSHRKLPRKAPEKSPIYVFPRHTNRTVDY